MRAPSRFVAALAFASLFSAGILGSRAFAAADDRSVTAAILADLDRDVAHKAMTADSVRRSREALERGSRMRQSGDEVHAKIADGIAREWAEIGRDLVRTTDSEKKAFDARRDATDAGAYAERERALLEEALAQNGRLRTQLEAVERERKEEPAKTAKVGASLDAGAPLQATPLGGRKPGADGGAAPRGAVPSPRGSGNGNTSLDGGGP
jgi:hypothetical protein